MTRRATWKVLTLSAALLGLGIAGAGAAMAQPDVLREGPAIVGADVDEPQRAVTPPGGCADSGAFTTQCQTRGSTQIFTAPNPFIGNGAGIYGPFFHQGRGGLGGAAAVGGGR